MEYLPISEATKIYKISKTSLTRLANKNINNVSVRKENGMFLIGVELLDKKYKKRVPAPKEKAEHITEHVRTISRTRANTSEPKKDTKEIELVEILREQLSTKDAQLEKMDRQLSEKDSQIKGHLQRQYEQNTIIQTLNTEIRTLQNRIDKVGDKIDNSVMLLSEKVKEEKQNDNFGYTLASSVMIILLVVAIIVFLTMK